MVAARKRRREAATAALALLTPPEKISDGKDSSVVCAVHCPDGTRLVRRFRSSDAFLNCFHLVEAQWVPPVDSPPLPADFSLVTRHPRKCVSRAEAMASMTFAQAGLASGQEALFVETGAAP